MASRNCDFAVDFVGLRSRHPRQGVNRHPRRVAVVRTVRADKPLRLLKATAPLTLNCVYPIEPFQGLHSRLSDLEGELQGWLRVRDAAAPAPVQTEQAPTG